MHLRALALFSCLTLHAAEVTPGSDDPAIALQRFRAVPGFKVEVFAAEPLIQNVVSFAFDNQGKAYVVETGRRRTSVFDIRNHLEWLESDLAFRTVEDRAQFLMEHVHETNRVFMESIAKSKRFSDFNHDGIINWRDLEVESERLRVVADRDGDGRADESAIFSDRYETLVSGLGAGVLVRGSNVWFTCIPDLWLLHNGGGGIGAVDKRSLHRGFGVHMGLGGHDMHGLIMGPDGRIYWSIADRGSHVEKNGKVLVDLPDTGAVFRSEPDGSHLEVFAYGLRNPQELAFDDFGNLWTVDNNADGGDKARVVYVMPGSDSGWRIGWQWLPRLGAWNSERLWQMSPSNTAAYILPPVGHVGRGPAGLAYYPGTGMPEKFRRHFLMCDFPDGVRSFAVETRGAGFGVIEDESFLSNLFATDVAFGPRGGAYISDWVQGWDKTGKGRIYRAFVESAVHSEAALETGRLLSAGFAHLQVEELAKYLGHSDQRVRQEAQFALVDKGEAARRVVLETLRTSSHQLARIHAVWAFGQWERRKAPTLEALLPFTRDPDPEIRAQVARTAGDALFGRAAPALLDLLSDTNPRVRSLAAISLGQLHVSDAASTLARVVETAGEDVFLRYAGILGLTGCASGSQLATLAVRPSVPVRLAAVVALRRHRSILVSRFLDDSDPAVQLEAARAINDEPINDALPDLAAKLDVLKTSPGDSQLHLEAIGLRSINAAIRLGHAPALGNAAKRLAGNDTLSVAAVRALGSWREPTRLDRITGLLNPVPGRDREPAVQILLPLLPEILASPQSEALKLAALEAVERLELREAANFLFQVFSRSKEVPSVRGLALKLMGKFKDSRLEEVLKLASADGDPAVRKQASELLRGAGAEVTLDALTNALALGSLADQQILISRIPPGQNGELLVAFLLRRALENHLPQELQLDVFEAAQKHSVAAITQDLATWTRRLFTTITNKEIARFAMSLQGGNAAAGSKLFFERQDLGCVRCHKVASVGGEVGPDLTSVGKQRSREHLLESIVLPNKEIAVGYENIVFTLKDGTMVAGTVRNSDAVRVVLNSPEDGIINVKKEDILKQDRGLSSMPEDLPNILSSSELRDLVEFLSSRN